jgi:hypothetical protein
MRQWLNDLNNSMAQATEHFNSIKEKKEKQQLQVLALKRRYSSRTFRYGYLVTT